MLCFRINSIRELNFNEMIKIFSNHKLLLAAYLILAPLNAITSISFSLSLTPLIGAATQLDGSLFVQAVLACLCIAGLDLAVALLCKYVQLRWIQSCMDTLRQTLADGILQGDMNSFRGQDISGYISMFSNDASRLKETYFESLCGIYENSWSFVFSMVTLLFFNAWIGLFLLAIGFLSLGLPTLFTKKLNRAQSVQMHWAQRHLSLIHDIFCGYWIIRNHGVERCFSQKYHGVSQSLSKADLHGEFLPYKVSWLSSGITTISFIGVIALSVYSVIQGRISADFVLSLSQLIGGVLVPMELIPNYFSKVKGSRQIWDKLKGVAHPGKAQDHPAPDFPGRPWNTISISGLSFTYEGSGPQVLSDLSLRLERGKKYVIIGRSGSGKSTLAKIMAGRYPAQFSLSVDGNTAPPESLYRHVSYVDQAAFLFHDTIYQNVSFFRNISREKVKAILERMELFPSLEAEDILDMEVGEDGGKLSGGEKQRVALARELIVEKDILILDEYTSNLDPKTARELDELILGLEGMTCLVITHQLDSLLLKRCDAVLSMEEGRIVPM